MPGKRGAAQRTFSGNRVQRMPVCQACSYSSGESPLRPAWMRRGSYQPSMYRNNAASGCVAKVVAGQYISSDLRVDHRFSGSELSKLSPTLPVDGAMPASTRRWVHRTAVYWAGSPCRCDGSAARRERRATRSRSPAPRAPGRCLRGGRCASRPPCWRRHHARWPATARPRRCGCGSDPRPTCGSAPSR